MQKRVLNVGDSDIKMIPMPVQYKNWKQEVLDIIAQNEENSKKKMKELEHKIEIQKQAIDTKVSMMNLALQNPNANKQIKEAYGWGNK